MLSFENKGSVASTIVVSLSPDLTGNYVCSGAADEVEINLALAEANRRGGGRVLLLQGTYVLAAPITFPGAELILQGMGRATLIDGDALSTANHGIVVDGRSDCVIRDLSIQTEDGGQKVCHCIFVDNSSDRLLIENVTIVDSDDNGVHIEGISQADTRVLNCNILGADGHGIYVGMDGANLLYNFEVKDCRFTQIGGDGVHLDRAKDAQIFDNAFDTGIIGDGIELVDSDDCHIAGNTVSGVTGYDVNISAASCDRTRVFNNILYGDGTGCINDVGTDTRTPELNKTVENTNSYIGRHAVAQMLDDVETTVRLAFTCPMDFQELVTAQLIIVPAAAGNLRWDAFTDWGKLCATEDYNTHSDTVGATTTAVLADDLVCVDVSAALNVAALTPGDRVGMEFWRDGDNALDTINDTVYVVGIRLRYV